MDSESNYPSRRQQSQAFQRPQTRQRRPRPIQPTLRRDNLLQKLFLRECFGEIRSTRRPTRNEALTKPFTTSLPARLAFCLRDIVPLSAIEAGHIFLGFSKCGQFLLSYTHTSADFDITANVDFNKCNYRLHWWLFVPSRKAKKVAEALLFSNRGAYGNLHISFCQWPSDQTKLVVFGHVVSENEGACQESKVCYVTVTTVPSLNACQDCLRVAASYEEESYAEAWNSCVRVSCLKHGLTVHTTFDLVRPYPTFEPKVNLKRDGFIVVNTGNLLHALSVDLEVLKASNDRDEDTLVEPATTKNKWSELQIGTSEFFISPGLDLQSPPLISPMAVWTSHNSTFPSDSESESDTGSTSHRSKNNYVLNEERLAKVAKFVEQLQPQVRDRLRRRSIRGKVPTDDASNSANCPQKRSMADKAYELTDDDFDTEGVREKLSTFRKKRLAEKKYEFKDEDSENVPLSRLRSQVASANPEMSANDVMKSPRSQDAEILRPLDSNRVPNEDDGNSDSDMSGILRSPSGMSKRETHVYHSPPYQQSMFSPKSSHHSTTGLIQPPRFHAKFTRRFIELDDEMVSIITDIEDDEMGTTMASGYHTALPLEVNGTAYQPMAMISNSKASKLTGQCVKVVQRSFDLEVFCHHMAQKFCLASNMKYWFCNDYDVEVVDVDPASGEIIFVAVVLIQATMSIKRVSASASTSTGAKSHMPQPLGSPPYQGQNQYQAYEASFKFSWNMDTAECAVIDSEPLKEINFEILQKQNTNQATWHPAKEVSMALQKEWGVMNASKVKCFTNDALLKGTSLKSIVDTDHLVAIIHDHLEQQ